MGFFDYAFNVVRNFSDFMHILAYLLIALIFLLLSIYRFDKKLYEKHIYIPLANLFKSQYIFYIKTIFKKLLRLFIMIFQTYAPASLKLASSRLPYYSTALKRKVKLVINKIKNTKKKITNFFKKK